MTDTEHETLCDKSTDWLTVASNRCPETFNAATSDGAGNWRIVTLTDKRYVVYTVRGNPVWWHYAQDSDGTVYQLEPLMAHNGTRADSNRRNWPRERAFKAALKAALSA